MHNLWLVWHIRHDEAPGTGSSLCDLTNKSRIGIGGGLKETGAKTAFQTDGGTRRTQCEKTDVLTLTLTYSSSTCAAGSMHICLL